MFGSGISFSGLASGLDTTSIVTQLVALERLPIQQLETQRDDAQTKLDLVGNFGDLVKSLQTAADSLRASTDFYSFSTSMSVEGTASISAGSGAEPGTHTLEVLSTASTDRWAFDGVADSDTALGGGNFSFDVNGTSYNLAVDAGPQRNRFTDQRACRRRCERVRRQHRYRQLAQLPARARL
ncbi:MAG TPA: hypothetical protein EYP98_04595 [Planctomycetes bacterium]|nr:hypothetical protein [Planctomycetota bacterium]